MTGILQIESVAKTYLSRWGKTVEALKDLSLTVETGSFKVVHGASGSGKTTLLLAAGGLLQPDRGTVRVGGEDLYAKSSEQRARFRAEHIGFVFQQFHLIPYLSVLENVLTPGLALPRNESQQRARELIDYFGLSHRLEHPPSELSTGEKQRVALARALLNQPRLLLADEPTGNLDEHNAALVLQHLHDFASRGGAVLLATHDSRIPADEKYHLEGGKVIKN